jgi:hypothetical protein
MDLAGLMVLHTQEYDQMRRPFKLYGFRRRNGNALIARMTFQRAAATVVPTTTLPVTWNDGFGIAYPCWRGLSLENRLERCFQATRYRTCLQASVRNAGLLREQGKSACE